MIYCTLNFLEHFWDAVEIPQLSDVTLLWFFFEMKFKISWFLRNTLQTCLQGFDNLGQDTRQCLKLVQHCTYVHVCMYNTYTHHGVISQSEMVMWSRYQFWLIWPVSFIYMSGNANPYTTWQIIMWSSRRPFNDPWKSDTCVSCPSSCPSHAISIGNLPFHFSLLWR